jgi:hypothetical protein
MGRYSDKALAAIRSTELVRTVPEPVPQGDCILGGIEDPDIRAEVAAFRDVLGGTLWLTTRPFKPADGAAWGKGAATRIFDEYRKVQARAPRQSLAEKEAAADRAREDRKAERKFRDERDDRIQAGWAKWCRWHAVDPVAANRYRAERLVESPDDETGWLFTFSSYRKARIPAELKKLVKKGVAL